MPAPIHARKPFLLLSFFESKTTSAIVTAAKKAHIPKDVPVVMGSYGINPNIAKQVHSMPNGRYAPIFAMKPSRLWTKRHLSTHDAAKVPAAQKKYAGAIPQTNSIGNLPPKDQLGWGIELGRRMRDDMRSAGKEGTRIDTWQFDEILGEAGQPGMEKLREFQRGVLLGLYGGRKELGDKPKKGVVFLAHTSLRLASTPVSQEIGAFWKTLNDTTVRIVGEEYPDFLGKTKTAADVQGAGQTALSHGGPIRKQLAEKYMVGLTPGYRLGVGLGGNVGHKTRDDVNRWRDGFMHERGNDGVAGFAEYNFRFENAKPAVIQDTINAMAKAVKGLP